ncbi:MAG: hypothetical protein ABIH53_01235 [archaeon]
MKGSVQVTENGIPILNKDWGELVDKPSKEWHFIEAFASADAIIDNELNFLFYKKIGVKKTKRRKWLSGLDKASILESKGIIDVLPGLKAQP